jgi:hypothetical protein
MIIKCVVCHYSANNQRDYSRHCQTKKHLENVQYDTVPRIHAEVRENPREKMDRILDNFEANHQNNCNDNKLQQRNNIIQCQHCMKIFARKDSLPRHLSVCKIKREMDIKEKYELELKLQLQEKDIKHMKKQIEELKEDKEFQNKVIASESNNLNGALQVNMNTLNFLKTYHTDTPPLKTFSQEFADPYKVYEQKGIKYVNDGYIENGVKIEKDKYITDKMIFLEESGNTVKFFASLMESIYRNKKYPHLQAYWAKDTTRYNYSVRIMLDNNTAIWSEDKDGSIIIDKVVSPLLLFTEEVLKKELVKLSNQVEIKNKEKDISGLMPILKRQGVIAGFINKVEKNELQQDIIKKMAKAFHLDVNKQMNYVNTMKNKLIE